ncbi:hypothetical protein L2E82_26029 [Cichorium intybus]|uniref:Uncharacterized protein n=1 Tax=Cichorium intybus TaxID=13427 RepID=A0ACB9E5V3_CICIN|nr:hypothetical protein L2E82_26029 [Cichorium intybus]
MNLGAEAEELCDEKQLKNLDKKEAMLCFVKVERHIFIGIKTHADLRLLGQLRVGVSEISGLGVRVKTVWVWVYSIT